ncbi:hypothetical protein [Falsibacillus albus]|uniref:DUF3221 domain-containing protein n=1 Tax=Falsibacillus albus TaxID=2478915 RepID=A0A3L7JUX8_9BACI|nr:hypothetical protein [Falsibacillus albus]RLQ94320.1 hypothetical protein D9X91_14790 [Falsibacillus albus]
MKKFIGILVLSLVLTGCGTKELDHQVKSADASNQEKDTKSPENKSGWNTIKVVSGRPIIAKLKPNKGNSAKREEIITKIMEEKEFKEGVYGKATKELAEDLSVQQVEGQIAIPLANKIYGSHQGFDQAGVIFFENQSSGDKQAGLWIGIKKADDKLKKLVDGLQAKVDAGEINAKYIYIFYTPHTMAENNQLNSKVVKALNDLKRDSDIQLNSAFSAVSVNTIDGSVKIAHNFITKKQQDMLRKQFPDRKFHFKQQGRMVPRKGEPDVEYPKEKYTDQPVKKGQIILSVGDGDFMVGSTIYKFKDAAKKLKQGQRVIVDSTGFILDSLPGRGTAVYVTVLPDYKPKNADLSESEVVRKALAKNKNNRNPGIGRLAYDEQSDSWVVGLKSDGILDSTKTVFINIDDK